MLEEQTTYLKWKSIHPFENRLNQSKENRYELEPNCYGTAFFLKGILPYDQIVFSNNHNKNMREAISLMNEHDVPVDDSIFVSFSPRGNIIHAGYILRANPLFGYHRTGSQGKLKEVKNLLIDVEDGYLNDISVLDFSERDDFVGEYVHKFYTVNNNSLDSWAKKITAQYDPYWWA